MGSSLRRSHRAWLLKVSGVLATCLAAGLVTAGVVSGTSAIASLSTSTDTTETDATASQPAPAAIWSDKEDYVPSEAVTLYGTGWQPGEPIHIWVNDDEGRTWSHAADVTADALGALEYGFVLPNWFVATYTVVATGEHSGPVTTSFTDAVTQGGISALINNGTGTSGTTPASAQITISAPAVVKDDVLVAHIVAAKDFLSGHTICTPAGWNPILENGIFDGSKNKLVQKTYYHVAPGTLGATSYTWQFKTNTSSCGTTSANRTSTGASGVVIKYAGVDPSNPIDVTAEGDFGDSTGPYEAPAVDTVTDGANVLRFFGAHKSPLTITPSTSPPRIYSFGSNNNSAERTAGAFQATQATAGDTGAFTATFSTSAEWAAQTVALRPLVSNVAPATPADLGQFRSNGTTAIPVGGFTNETTVVLKGALSDPDTSDMVRLQVEVEPVGTAFDGAGLVSGPFVTDPATASATVSGVAHGTGYHWRGRAVDDDGAASAWSSFAGNPESAADFTVDTAKPTLTASATSPPLGPAYVAGTWTNQDVKVAFACADALSGVATDTVPDVIVSTDGENQSVTSSGACVDAAGNDADSATFADIDLDKTAPEVDTTLDRGPDHNGWYNAPVGWTSAGTDDTSGIAACDTGTHASDGEDLTVTGSCTDHAGNSASDTTGLFDYDATDPVDVTTALDRSPDHNGWYNAPVGWETSATDATSGIGECSGDTYAGPDGEDLTISGTCTDVAGNVSTADASGLFDYDATAPELETTLDRGPDHNGWYNAPVGWTSAGTDDTSGIAACDTGTHASDGEDLTVTGSCTDHAGNSASDTTGLFDYDATDPVDVTTALDRSPDHNGWYNAAVDWTTSGTDATSGLAECDEGTHSGPDGEDLTVTGSCTDHAGNESAPAASAAFDYDATDPTLSPTVVPSPVLLNGSATASPNATDNLSGVASASCATPDTSTVGAKSVACTATDNAGNHATAYAWYSVVYDFAGFFQPIDNGGVLNVVQAGRAIPVKFSLAGYQGMSIFAAGYPAWTTVSCATGTGSDPLEETMTAGNSSLQYDATANQYIYVWKTEKTWPNSCRRLDVKLVDGSIRSAYFSFKK